MNEKSEISSEQALCYLSGVSLRNRHKQGRGMGTRKWEEKTGEFLFSFVLKLVSMVNIRAPLIMMVRVSDLQI